MTTQAAFITTVVSTLTVTGVTKKFAYPPKSLPTADLPASFPKGFRRQQGPLTFQAHGGWPTMQVDFFIAVEPVAQSTQPTNYALVQTLADNLDAALAGTAVGAIGKGKVTWQIRGGDVIVEVAGTAYWAVLAVIEGKG